MSNKFFTNKIFLACLFLFISTFLVFTFKFRYYPTGDTIPNQLLPIAIIYHHTLDLNAFYCPWDKASQSFKYSPEICKKEYWWTPINGKVISTYPIIPGIMNLPVYFVAYLFKINLLNNIYLLSLITAAIISSLSVVFMFFLLKEICKTDV